MHEESRRRRVAVKDGRSTWQKWRGSADGYDKVLLASAKTAFSIQPFVVECLPLYKSAGNILNGTLGM